MLKLGRCIGSIVTCVQMSSSNDTHRHEAAAASVAAAPSVQKRKGLKNGGVAGGRGQFNGKTPKCFCP